MDYRRPCGYLRDLRTDLNLLGPGKVPVAAPVCVRARSHQPFHTVKQQPKIRNPQGLHEQQSKKQKFKCRNKEAMIRMTVKISGRILSDPNRYHPTPSQRCKDRGHPGPVHAQHGPCGSGSQGPLEAPGAAGSASPTHPPTWNASELANRGLSSQRPRSLVRKRAGFSDHKLL